MKKTYNKNYIFLIYTLVSLLLACNKEKDWLDIKSNKESVVPETLKDFQAILDNTTIMNSYYSFRGNIGTDNYYVPEENYGRLREFERDLYNWNTTINWTNGSVADWNDPYTVIAFANLVLEGLDKVDPKESNYNNLLGQAYFYRAFAYLNLSQVFCIPYSAETADKDLGLPLRLSSDVNIILPRSNLKELYYQVINDVERSLEFLDEIPLYNQRPSKLAAKALLAKVYLLMNDFKKALFYADGVLQVKYELIDFNNVNQVSHSYRYKFPAYGRGNPEILFYVCSRPGNNFALNYLGNTIEADKSLYSLYEENDLRKDFFFGISAGEKIKYVSTYEGNGYSFGGLATNEILLIRAECFAREGKVTEALADLNRLLKNRYRTGTFQEFEVAEQETLIHRILLERRKELPNVGNVRWEDLRRLNSDPKYQTTLTRVIEGATFILLPNDPRYVLPIPEKEISLSGIVQNIR